MADPPGKKRVSLPVVGQPRRAIDDADLGDGVPTARAPGAWILLGTLFTFAVLVPAAMIGLALVKALANSVVPIAIAAVVSVGLASAAGGWLIGRFGGGTGPREGALSGALSGVIMAGLSVKGGGHFALSLVILLVTVPAAWAASKYGRRTRKPGDT